jgi:hypothetical protein
VVRRRTARASVRTSDRATSRRTERPRGGPAPGDLAVHGAGQPCAVPMPDDDVMPPCRTTRWSAGGRPGVGLDRTGASALSSWVSVGTVGGAPRDWWWASLRPISRSGSFTHGRAMGGRSPSTVRRTGVGTARPGLGCAGDGASAERRDVTTDGLVAVRRRPTVYADCANRAAVPAPDPRFVQSASPARSHVATIRVPHRPCRSGPPVVSS